jgi:hypothetical protein
MVQPVLDLFVPTSEAAFIADVSDREMNRAVDEHILPEPLIRSGNGRRFARLGAAPRRAPKFLHLWAGQIPPP